MSTNTAIPSSSDVKVQEAGSSWRFSQGAMVRGQEIQDDRGRETGRYPEEMTRLVGVLRRVGIYDNPNSKFGKKLKLEADIETAEGMVHIGVNLLKPSGELKPTISAVGFAWCLLQFEKDGLMMIETKLGEAVQLEDGTKGGRPTYVNAYQVDGNNAKPLYRPKRDKDAPRQTMLEQWAELEAQIRAHAAYKEREVRADDGDDDAGSAPAVSAGHKALNDLAIYRQWPTLEKAPETWLLVFQKLTKEAGPRESLLKWTDAELAQFAAALTKLPEDRTPAAIADWKKRAEAGEFDPFADKPEAEAGLDLDDI